MIYNDLNCDLILYSMLWLCSTSLKLVWNMWHTYMHVECWNVWKIAILINIHFVAISMTVTFCNWPFTLLWHNIFLWYIYNVSCDEFPSNQYASSYSFVIFVKIMNMLPEFSVAAILEMTLTAYNLDIWFDYYFFLCCNIPLSYMLNSIQFDTKHAMLRGCF